MPTQVQFTNMKNSDTVRDHIDELMKELVKITDNKFPFHIHLSKANDESYSTLINCSYMGKPLSSKAEHTNLYKAISKSVDSMKTQVMKKHEKVRK